MMRARTSLPQGQATCQPCRRQAPEYRARILVLAERQATPLQQRTCPNCGNDFMQTRRRQRYCSGECRRVRQRSNWGTGPTKAKYRSPEHRRERARLVLLMETQGYLTCAQPVCVMATRTIEQGEAWHLGHDDLGISFIGPTHATCNVKDGARRGNARSRGPARRWAV